jgi:hypothetical protein
MIILAVVTPEFNLRIIFNVSGRFRLSTSDTRARLPM